MENWKRNQGSYQNFNNLNQTIRFFVLIKSICISQNQFKRNVQFMNRYFIDGNKNSLYFSSLQTGLCPKLYHRCTWTISDDAINFKQFKGNKIDFKNSGLKYWSGNDMDPLCLGLKLISNGKYQKFWFRFLVHFKNTFSRNLP